jgi:hypothetical protein
MARITNQKDLRAEFWATSGRGLKHRKTVKFGDEKHYPTNTRVAFVDFVDSMQRGGEISDDLAERATLGGMAGFGSMTMNWSEFGQQMVAPFVGGGSALITSAAFRRLGPAGSWIEKHAGLLGAMTGIAVAAVSKQGGAGVASAALIGLGIEAIEMVTSQKMSL